MSIHCFRGESENMSAFKIYGLNLGFETPFNGFVNMLLLIFVSFLFIFFRTFFKFNYLPSP